MPSRRVCHASARVSCLAIMLLSGVAGLLDWDEITVARGTWQVLVALSEFICGVTGVLGAIEFWRGQIRARSLASLWAAGALVAATVAPRAYDTSAAWSADLLSGIGTALVVIPVTWYVRHTISSRARTAEGDIRDGPMVP